ncbi:MAG: hypothetical protein ACXWD7_00345 [Solirubrobacterales bacterium]
MGRSGNSQIERRAPDNAGRGLLLLAACLGLVVLTGCGGGTRQDAGEPSGEYPVQIVKSDFATRQRLAETSDLTLAVRNAGDKTIPQLAITISTDPNADESFSVRSDQEGLAIPSRAVWELNFGYPKLAGESAPAGADAAQTKTFNFGPLDGGETREMIWSLTPVVAGTYTIGYKVAAGLNGKAIAVTPDGSVPEGAFVVRISDVPPQTRVDDSGKVVPIEPGDVIGQAGSSEQRGEVGAGTGTGTGTGTSTGTSTTGGGGGQ